MGCYLRIHEVHFLHVLLLTDPTSAPPVSSIEMCTQHVSKSYDPSRNPFQVTSSISMQDHRVSMSAQALPFPYAMLYASFCSLGSETVILLDILHLSQDSPKDEECLQSARLMASVHTRLMKCHLSSKSYSLHRRIPVFPQQGVQYHHQQIVNLDLSPENRHLADSL